MRPPDYLISRMLGPEFGGTVGVVLFASNVAGCVLYILGFIETMMGAFGAPADGFKAGSLAHALPQGYWVQYAYASVLLLVCLAVVGVGARLFAASSFAIWVILMASIASIFGSLLFNGAGDVGKDKYGYTGVSGATLVDNLLPDFKDKGARVRRSRVRVCSRAHARRRTAKLFHALCAALSRVHRHYGGRQHVGRLAHAVQIDPQGHALLAACELSHVQLAHSADRRHHRPQSACSRLPGAAIHIILATGMCLENCGGEYIAKAHKNCPPPSQIPRSSLWACLRRRRAVR